MADPVLTAERVQITPEVGTHPLATKTGLTMMTELLLSDRVWSACTKPQRALLTELCAPVAADLIARGELAATDLPLLPDTVRQSTRDALHRRGLVDNDGRVTGTAVHAYWWQVEFQTDRPGGRP